MWTSRLFVPPCVKHKGFPSHYSDAISILDSTSDNNRFFTHTDQKLFFEMRILSSTCESKAVCKM